MAHEGKNFEPTSGVLYIRPFVLPASTSTNDLSGKDMYGGVFQIDVMAPVGKGRVECDAMCDTIAAHFNRQTLTYGGQDTIIRAISRTGGTVDGDRYKVSVSIEFDSYFTR